MMIMPFRYSNVHPSPSPSENLIFTSLFLFLSANQVTDDYHIHSLYTNTLLFHPSQIFYRYNCLKLAQSGWLLLQMALFRSFQVDLYPTGYAQPCFANAPYKLYQTIEALIPPPLILICSERFNSSIVSFNNSFALFLFS